MRSCASRRGLGRPLRLLRLGRVRGTRVARDGAPLRLVAALIFMWLALIPVAPVLADGEFQKGLKAARAGYLISAIESWDKVLRRRPDCYAAAVNRGTAHMMSGFVFRGVSDWHKARSLAPALAYAYYGVNFIDEARGGAPLVGYVASLELDPDHTTSVILTGAALIELGRPTMAAALFRKSMDLTKNPLLKNRLLHWAESVETTPERR